MFRMGMIGAIAMALPAAASAQSLHLDYTVTELGGGLYMYDFALTPCEGWEAGMGWRGLIWGDCASCPTPLTDFAGDMRSLPVGPWIDYGTATGAHAGAMFEDPGAFWVPASADETLVWSGISTADLAHGDLLFSAMEGTGGAMAVSYKVAVRDGPVCYPDCDGSGYLDIFDFLCFQNAFATSDPYADCDGCGALDFFDFLCFQSAFASGC